MENKGVPIVGILQQISEALDQVNTGAKAVVSSISEAEAVGQQAVASLESTAATLQSTENQVAATAATISSSVQEAENEVIASTERLQRRVQTTAESAFTKFEELLAFLEKQQDPGSVGLLASLQAFEEGLVDKTKLLMSFGESVIFYKGEMVLVKELLDKVLPATGTVQKRISDLRKNLETERISTDEILARLKESHFQYAQILGEMVEGFRSGRVSLEEIQRAATQLQRQFQGSEAATIAQQLAERARQGRL